MSIFVSTSAARSHCVWSAAAAASDRFTSRRNWSRCRRDLADSSDMKSDRSDIRPKMPPVALRSVAPALPLLRISRARAPLALLCPPPMLDSL